MSKGKKYQTAEEWVEMKPVSESRMFEREDEILGQQGLYQQTKLVTNPFNDLPSSQVTESGPMVIPKQWSNESPSEIKLNGLTYAKNSGAEKKGKKTKMPSMKVYCESCYAAQSIPGNSKRYLCCTCKHSNHCTPVYALFICSYCQSKVCYAFNMSEKIRCTKCSAINRVPLSADIGQNEQSNQELAERYSQIILDHYDEKDYQYPILE